MRNITANRRPGGYCLLAFLMLMQTVLVGEIRSAPDEVPGLIKPPFAWNRTDRYEPPDSKTFFPDDKTAGEELAACLQGARKWPIDVDQRLALIRRGLRNCQRDKTRLLGALGNEFVWNRDPQDPRAIELLYHASDLSEHELAHTAFYHGPTVVLKRSPNLVRTLMQQYQEWGVTDQSRIIWGMKTYGDAEETRRLLLQLLDSHEDLDEGTVCAAIDTYRGLFETMPPEMQRFDHIGKWIVAFHRTDLSASHPHAAQILREQTDKLMRGQETLVIDFVTRVVDGYETAVVLLQGEKARHEFVTRLEQHIFAKLDFNFLLSPRILRECRLREFGRYLPGGIPVRARPTYTRPEVGESFAFNATTWVAPDFENYFADDEDAGRKLDEVYQQKESLEMSDRELLRLFRRGVRRSKQTPNEMFGWISGALGWPLDPMLSEIMFQAVDPRGPFPFRDAAVYYGYNLNKPKTKNMLEALVQAYLAEPFDRTSNSNFRGRILWSVRDHEDHRYFLATRFESALKNHQQLSDEALRPTDLAYRQLANRAPPNQHEYDHRIVDVVGFVIPENQSLMAAKQLFEDRMESNEFLLDTEIRQEKNQVQGLSVTRGFEGPRLLAAKLKEEFNWPVNFALPLTPVVWKELGDKLPARFQDYLPVTK